MSSFDLPPSPSDEFAPPPAYEFSQQEYDHKIRTATERSQEEHERREQTGPLEEWESWDEALFEANATQGNNVDRTEASNQNASSSSSAAPTAQSTTQRQTLTASAKAREAMGQDPYYGNGQYASAAPVRPLFIQKKSARQSQAEKERPSWFNEAQLGGSSSSGQPQGSSQPTSTARRALPTPVQPQQRPPQHVIPEEPEEDRSLPPPPFAPVGESLDGPAYERYPGEAQRRPSGAGVILSYNGEDLSASPPPSPLRSPVTPVQELNMRRRDTPPRLNASPNPYQHMQYQAPQARRQASRQTLAQSPTPPPLMARQQYVPPPPRMDFNPSVAYETMRPSIFGQLPMETLRRGEGAAALYNSAVAAHMTSTPVRSRQPVSTPHRRYAGSVASTVSDYSINSMYQPQLHAQQNYQQPQQFYSSQDFNASRATFFPQVPVNPIPQYPSQAQAPYPERPMSSMSSVSQGEQRSWPSMQPQYQQQYYQGR